MECPNCNTNRVINFLQEKTNCPHCGETIYIDHYLCTECETTFKVTGNEIYSSIQFSEEEFKNMFGGTKEELLSRFDMNTMSDTIHSCTRCGGLVFEIAEGIYKCNKCGFEVETGD